MNNPLVVGDQFRSELSQVPGGKNILVTYEDGTQRIYDKIKNPNAYIKKLKTDGSIIDIKVY
jgi:hypothetical protein